MGTTWQDPPQAGGAQFQLPVVPPGSKALLWSNGILFALALLWPGIVEVFALWPGQWARGFPLVPFWQVLTYGFLHTTAYVSHVLFNLLGIYFFGAMLEGLIGSRRFLAWYLAAIVIGGLAQLAGGLVSAMADPAAETGYTLGASGGVMFLIVACATLRPHTIVIFILFPLKLRTLALIWVGIDLFGLLRGGGGTAYLVHLAGAALGFAAARLDWLSIDPLEKVQERLEASRERGAEEDARRLDKLLQQIHQQGIGSLTKREKDFLKRMSSRK